jgi:hypothetical protein
MMALPTTEEDPKMESIEREITNFLTTPVTTPKIQKWEVTLTHLGLTARYQVETPWNKKHGIMLDAVKALISEKVGVSHVEMAKPENGWTFQSYKKNGVIY